MFNGIIKNTGKVSKIIFLKNDCFIKILSKLKFSKKEIGSSISCSGVCLTLTNISKNLTTFYVSKETLYKTNFGKLKIDDKINLEKSIKFGDRISGHFVLGHIDTTAKVKNIYLVGKTWFVNFVVSKKYKKLLIQKGSIAINGVSLTISKTFKKGFQITIIPQTLKLTNLIYLTKNDIVNVEFDFLLKYINNLKK